jgi:hypothetical protein
MDSRSFDYAQDRFHGNDKNENPALKGGAKYYVVVATTAKRQKPPNKFARGEQVRGLNNRESACGGQVYGFPLTTCGNDKGMVCGAHPTKGNEANVSCIDARE